MVYRNKMNRCLSQVYHNIKLHFSPSYQAASALVLNQKVTPSNLEHLVAVAEGKEAGVTYDSEVLNYAGKILKGEL
ncbi:MAG: hypothetical protein M1284_02055 [Candidatus Parvarchaeota archaeon]|jgi:hypothetical protein|nr:hypothetical protein [Candidatus Parvarchaeota archaeon]